MAVRVNKPMRRIIRVLTVPPRSKPRSQPLPRIPCLARQEFAAVAEDLRRQGAGEGTFAAVLDDGTPGIVR